MAATPITLRPEGTAGVCRALVSNGLTQSLPRKVFYAGPMFRYERPQKGRYRQFHQIGVELIGPAEPLADAEVIACGWDVLTALGVSAEIVLELNTLGDAESRGAYREALIRYFTARKAGLSHDSLLRLERNPLRILDSKNEGDRAIVAEAPTIGEFLTAPAAAFYAELKSHLGQFGVPFRDNPRIVRGLDYYGHTAFEFVTGALGAQGTVLAGGRYDGLVAEMGGPPTPAVGWAAGIERLAMLLERRACAGDDRRDSRRRGGRSGLHPHHSGHPAGRPSRGNGLSGQSQASARAREQESARAPPSCSATTSCRVGSPRFAT